MIERVSTLPAIEDVESVAPSETVPVRRAPLSARLRGLPKYLFLSVFAVFSIFPLYFMAVSATNTSQDVLDSRMLPGLALFDNLAGLLELQDVGAALWNSTTVAVGTTVLALIVYVLWISLTFKKHGFVGGWKNITGYNKELGPILPLVVVLEFFSNLVIRPFTHAVRLFANMFAGHLLIVMFTIASWYLLNGVGIIYAGASFVMTLVMTAFELFIQAVQAYVFVLLACNYVQGALAENH